MVAELYEMAVERLESCGIRRYEISNFARPGFESRHNLKYWRLEPYVGFGADAHSFDGVLRRQNAESAAEYVANGEQPCVETRPAVPVEERFYVGLRLSEGIRPGDDDWRRFAAPIRRFLDAGLMETEGDRLRLSARGVLLSNEVLQEFLIG
jgi:oxygen-independent coproporphyrinogen-3 oxidase